ncbi:hypothetical protein F2P56_007671 [Juglans regia]|uniref:Disease resistance protein RGA3 n=1 Tax=Juglans regia TaxID=51240 RepID=A0A833XSK0_JUGRE|nr:hypothetical protein F2P56_007671 [Juglans regia]
MREEVSAGVLDDVWNEDQIKWESFVNYLRNGVEGCKILVTTRSENVASLVGTGSSYHLRGLPEDDCWELLKEQAFRPGEEEDHNLKLIGKQIVKKCGGVPLAAMTLGSLLRSSRDQGYWLSVKDRDLCIMDESVSGIMPALKLSYFHLKVHLKRCFAYCSLFPKSYDFKKEKLIHLWMAEGLILADGHNPLEDIGNGYFDDLLRKSFFQEVKDGKDDSTKVYRMHDLIHELAQSVAGNEFLKLEHGRPTPSDLAKTRHSSVVCNFPSSAIPPALLKVTRLRTLLLLSPGFSSEELPFLPTNFMYLRVLDISGSGIKKLQKSIGNLVSLRYLDLSKTSIQALPDTICDLCNLQTLNLSGCCHLQTLPDGMEKLINLRHLNITGCERLARMPTGIGKLVHLQTLPIYIVGKRNGEGISELSCLNLRGELNIKCLENVRDAKETKLANLKQKKHLHVLGLFWGNDDENRRMRLANHTAGSQHSIGSLHGHYSDARLEELEDILECLEPHEYLKKLFIKGYAGIKFPSWGLPSLTGLVLINLKRCKNLPSIGQLPLLKNLYLQAMEGIEFIDQDFYGADYIQSPFPSLKELTLRDFPNLKEWRGSNGGQGLFPRLEKLIVSKCPKLSTAPVIPSLQHVELQGCHPLLVNSMENLTSLLVMVIDTFPDLLLLPGELLKSSVLLTSLKISSCTNLSSLPSEIENLTALKSLSICWCQALSSLPQGLQNLTSLESLEISECNLIDSLPDDGIRGLSSLRTLSIENCTNLSSLSTGLQYLSALEHLTIMYCPKLDSLPNDLSNLSTLRSLSILWCPRLGSLPEGLQHVRTLQTLEIRSCPGLEEFPEWTNNLSALRSLAISDCNNMTSLPEELVCLSTLQHLSIQDCPNLEKWWKDMRRRDRRRISHISHIYIGSL